MNINLIELEHQAEALEKIIEHMERFHKPVAGATAKQQANNTHTNVYLERNGVRCTAKQFSERFNIPYRTVLSRYHTYGNEAINILMKEHPENFTSK